MPHLYQRNSQILARPVAGSLLLAPPDSSKGLYTLNSTGQNLWEWLAQPISVADLTSRLTSHYPSLTPQQAREDITNFLKEMLDFNFVTIQSP